MLVIWKQNFLLQGKTLLHHIIFHCISIYVQFTNKYSLTLSIHYIQLLVHCLKPTSVNQHRFFLLFLKTQEVFCSLDNTISWMLVLFVSLRHVKWNHTILQFSLSHPPIWPDSIWSQLHHLCSKLMSLVLVCSVCCTSCSTLPVVCANKRIAFSVSSQWFSESVSCQTKIICRKYVELLLYKGRQTRKFFELKHPRLSLMHTTFLTGPARWVWPQQAQRTRAQETKNRSFPNVSLWWGGPDNRSCSSDM